MIAKTITTLLISMLSLSAIAGSDWETDMDKALETAKESNRYLLLDFTGSDWCGWCIKLDKEVFSKESFGTYAKQNLVLVELDFPRRSTINPSLKKQNDALMQKYGVRGFPTIMVLDPAGELVHRTGYRDGGPEAYVDHLKSVIDPHRKEKGYELKKTTPAAAPATSSLFGVPYDANRESREWTSNSGNTIQASLVQQQGAHLVLKKEDGGKAMIPLNQLSATDQAYVKNLK